MPSSHPCLRRHVRGRINRLGKGGDRDREPLLDLLKHLGIAVRRHEGDGESLGTEPTRSTHSVQVRVGIGRSVLQARQLSSSPPRVPHSHS